VLVRPERERLEALAQMIEAGELGTTIRSEHPLDDAAEAHRDVLRGGRPGKSVIRVRPEP
jgi:NADPH:quinone reductase-like Zn-dependent oxidoreductase